MRIVGRAPHNRGGRPLVEAALRLRPDLIIVDITMPLLNLRRRDPEKEEATRLTYRSPASVKGILEAAQNVRIAAGEISHIMNVHVKTVGFVGGISSKSWAAHHR